MNSTSPKSKVILKIPYGIIYIYFSFVQLKNKQKLFKLNCKPVYMPEPKAPNRNRTLLPRSLFRGVLEP